MKKLKELEVLENQMRKPDKTIINSVNYNTFNGSISGLIKFSKTLHKQEPKGNDFFNIHTAIQQMLIASKNSLHAFPTDFNNLLVTKRQRDINNLDRNLREYLADYLSTLEFYGIASGAFEDLTRKHNSTMNKQNLDFLSVDQNLILSEFDNRKNVNSPLHVGISKSLFWTNKVVKYVKDSLPAMLLFESDNEKYSRINYSVINDISNKDKYIAICKSVFFDKLFKYFSSHLLPPDVNFANLLIYFNGMENPEEFENDPGLKKILDEQPTPPDSAISLLKSTSEEYNQLFADITPKTNFLDDAFCSNGILSTTAFLYKIKIELTKAILNLLIQEQGHAAKKIPNAGISYDEDNAPVLKVGLNGYLGIVGVHIPQFMLDEPGMKPALASLKPYQGIITKTHVLAPATEQQKKELKSELANSSSFNNPERRLLLAQYKGMATGEYFEFYKELNATKTK